ncbi:MAG: hypothetical protein ABIE70_12790 [bacterium]
MKTYLLVLFLVLSCGALAQDSTRPAVALPALDDISLIRSEAYSRRWVFSRGDTAIGTYECRTVGRSEVDGREAIEVEQHLAVELGRSQSPNPLTVDGSVFLAPNGAFLGIQHDMLVDEDRQEIYLMRQGDTLVGHITRFDTKVDQAFYFDLADPGLCFHMHFLDLTEILLAKHELRVGDTLVDTAFTPQMMTLVTFKAVVEQMRPILGTSGVKDTVYVINVMQPQRQLLYYSVTRQLIGAQFLGQGISARIDRTPSPAGAVGTESKQLPPGFSWSRILGNLPAYFVFVVVSGLALLMIGCRQLRSGTLFVAVLAGAASFVLIPWLQNPLQMFLFSKVMIPKVAAGGSAYFWGVFPALGAGVIQEILRLVVVLLLVARLSPSRNKIALLAAAAGAGFGLFEAAYLASFAAGTQALSWPVLERVFLVVYHVAAGVLLGRCLAEYSGGPIPVRMVLLLIGVNSLLRYLPVFVQQGAVRLELMYFVSPFIALSVLATAIVVMKKPSS